MSEFEKNTTLRNVLLKAAQEGMRVRIVGPPNTILSEGYVDFIGNGIVAIKHQEKEQADEFILLCNIIKVQYIGESNMSY